jgi:hypothetical protein
MQVPARMFLGALAASAAVLSTGCAHVQPVAQEEAQPTHMVVTGSRIPQRVDPRTGQVSSVSPVQVFTRDDLMRTGRGGNLAAALGALAPAVQ